MQDVLIGLLQLGQMHELLKRVRQTGKKPRTQSRISFHQKNSEPTNTKKEIIGGKNKPFWENLKDQHIELVLFLMCMVGKEVPRSFH